MTTIDNISEEIIAKAENLFLKLGIRSVSMDDLCREMGISKKTLYQYFENKDALVKRVIKTHVEREQAEINQFVNNSKDALDELNKIGLTVIRNIEDVSPSTLYDLQKYYRTAFDILMKEQNEFVYTCFFQNIKRGISEGLFRSDINPEIVARIFSSSSFFLVDALSDPSIIFTRKQMIKELYNYHVRGIATPKGVKLWEKYTRD
ncbi:MAG: TetR/AcrR family transcriptional regulator [Saprospiraceae bacterium]